MRSVLTKTVLFALFCTVAGRVAAQPGSYTNCFGFRLYEGKKKVTDTTGYRFVWQSEKQYKRGCRQSYSPDSTPYTAGFIIGYRYGTGEIDMLYIINPRGDTMHLRVARPGGMDNVYIVEKLVFRKGYYTAADSQYYIKGQGYRHIYTVRPTLYDSSGKVMIERFWHMNGKNTRQVQPSNQDGIFIHPRFEEYETE